MNDVQVAIENVGNIGVAKLEKGLTVMATISGGAPMLGFLGTVTGMVRAFMKWQMPEAVILISHCFQEVFMKL